jgi:7-cyano-7-deazaguanine synthase
MNKKRAVVLLSGGVDSSTALAIARAEGFDCFALSFDYTQRHSIELKSAKKVAESLSVKKHLTIRFNLREIGGSALTSDIEVPKTDVGDQGSGIAENSIAQAPIPVTYVPARNTIFLSFGLGWAEVLEAGDIFIGANVIDYSGYPDCRPEYLESFEETANLATKISVEGKLRFRINAPLLHMTKQEIITRGTELGLDYSLTWSCYDPRTGTSGGTAPCGACDSCTIRAKGFKDAGIPDPLLY